MESLKGRLLVAAPSLESPFFARTVILMLEHNDDGAMGIVLNRPTESTVDDIADQILEEPIDWNKTIYLGGPVRGPLQVLHDLAEYGDQEIVEGVRGTVSAENVKELLALKPEPSLVVANYAGWGTGQLEGEIDEDSWLTHPARAEHVFYPDSTDLWRVVLNEIHAAELSHVLGLKKLPIDPRVN
ncbi:MAG: YqgE/AlgH family protein [Isosphaeraceae bacterium]